MLHKFRSRFPQGSLTSELLAIDHGKYVVRVLVEVEGVILASGLAAADTVESAEDRARNRALELLNWDDSYDVQGMGKITSTPEPEKVNPILTVPIPEPKVKSQKKVATSPHQPTPEPRVETGATQETEVSPLTPDIRVESQEKVATSPHQPTPEPRKEATLSLPPESDEQPLPLAIPEITPDLFSLETNSVGEENGLPKGEQPSLFIPSSVEETDSTSAHSSAPEKSKTEALDFSDIIARTDMELKRLNWNQEQGRDYLLATYGKKSRLHLSDQELLEFLHYLEAQP